MTVRVCYVDESHDADRFCLSAICLKHGSWHECFKLVREHRTQLKRTYGLLLRKETAS